MTGPLNGARPATGLCRKAGCPELVSKKVDTGNGERKMYYCSVYHTASGKHVLKIPGNMSKCPKEAQA